MLAVGGTVHLAWEALDEIEKEGGGALTLFDPIWIKPLPERQILEMARGHSALLILEEHVLAGGFGSAVLELLSAHDLLTECRVHCCGVPDVFVEHGPASALRAHWGLDKDGFKKFILAHTR